jgi:hypothetical protein
MSSQTLTCRVSSNIEVAENYFINLANLLVQLPLNSALKSINELLEAEFESLPTVSLNVKKSDLLEIDAEFGSEVPVALIEAIITQLEKLEGVEFKARYFDSSSGGVRVWGDYDDWDIEGKLFFLTGKMDDKEYVEEMLEDIGELQEAFDEDTEVLILGEKPNKRILDAATKQGAIIMTEDEFVEYVTNQP